MTGIQDVDLTREMIVDLLRPYVEARESETTYGKAKTRLGELIKAYLEQSGDAEVYDGERNLVAHLQNRTSEAYDVSRAPEDLILLAWRMGALTVNVAAVKAQPAGSELKERLKPFAVPGRGSVALVVESRK